MHFTRITQHFSTTSTCIWIVLICARERKKLLLQIQTKNVPASAFIEVIGLQSKIFDWSHPVSLNSTAQFLLLFSLQLIWLWILYTRKSRYMCEEFFNATIHLFFLFNFHNKERARSNFSFSLRLHLLFYCPSVSVDFIFFLIHFILWNCKHNNTKWIRESDAQ